MGELLWEVRDANIPLLELDSDEWRGEEIGFLLWILLLVGLSLWLWGMWGWRE